MVNSNIDPLRSHCDPTYLPGSLILATISEVRNEPRAQMTDNMHMGVLLHLGNFCLSEMICHGHWTQFVTYPEDSTTHVGAGAGASMILPMSVGDASCICYEAA